MGPSYKLFLSRTLLIFLAIGIAAAAFPQAQRTLTDADIKAEEMKLYADSHPYLDDPPPELKQVVSELRGLEPASGPDRLPAILAGVGAKVKELLQDLPDLISRETVTDSVSVQTSGVRLPVTPSLGRPQVDSTSSTKAEDRVSKVQSFNYIVLVHETEGERMLEEYRTDRKGKPNGQGPEAPNSIGFVSLWVAFSPANQRNSKFRYLGEQKIGGHNNLVMAFAQTPGVQSHPGEISLPQGSTIPVLFQGVAWIDESDFRILRLRIDLLASQPQVGLKQLTAMIQFGSVRIAGLEMQLWLPREVKLDVDANGQALREVHQYSQYRLYKANAKVMTDAP